MLVTVTFEDGQDGRMLGTVQLPSGTPLLEALGQLEPSSVGANEISTLCFHPRLGGGGGGRCGVCAVDVLEGEGTEWRWKLGCQMRLTAAKTRVRLGWRGGAAEGIRKGGLQRAEMALRPPVTLPLHLEPEIEDLLKKSRISRLDSSSAAVVYDPSLCVGCSRCARACDHLQGMAVLHVDPVTPVLPGSSSPLQPTPCMELSQRGIGGLAESDCISCGQCTLYCPTGAIKERDHVPEVMRHLLDPSALVVLQVAPSVRVAWCEEFGGKPGQASAFQLAAVARRCGFSAVFDTNFGADLCVMEEAAELLQRIETGGTLPMFTSCCPAWVNLVEKKYPELIPHLSTCKSPGAMMSTLIREVWWPKQQQQERQRKLVVIQLMPCVAKKDEAVRPQLGGATTAVLTVREFGRLVKLRGVAQTMDEIEAVPPGDFDSPISEGSGAAVIFGVTGGVMEAALRTAAELIYGGRLETVEYEAVRGLDGVKRAALSLKKQDGSSPVELRVAVVSGTRNARELLSRMEQGQDGYNFHFVEVMSCPGGCIGGGGMPKTRNAKILSERAAAIYHLDGSSKKRRAHDNVAVRELYEQVLGNKPLAHEWLHTSFSSRPPPKPAALAGSAAAVVPSSSSQQPSRDGILIVFASVGGTAAAAASELCLRLRSAATAAEAAGAGNNLTISLCDASKIAEMDWTAWGTIILITCTYGEGELPEAATSLAKALENLGPDALSSVRFAVFGLGSTLYARGDQFNAAACWFDKVFATHGAQRILSVAKADDQSSEGYRPLLKTWGDQLIGLFFGKSAAVAEEARFVLPPPLVVVSQALSVDAPEHSCPPGFSLVPLKASQSLVPATYDRPASLFTFKRVPFRLGDHLAILPENDADSVFKLLAAYGVSGKEVVSIRALDPSSSLVGGDGRRGAALPEGPLTLLQLFLRYVDLSGPCTRILLENLALAPGASSETRVELRSLASLPEGESWSKFAASNTILDILLSFSGKGARLPLSTLLSVVPRIQPRLYSIASAPSEDNLDTLDLAIVLQQWLDPMGRKRIGLATRDLFFAAKAGKLMAVQVRRGILSPPVNAETPVVLIGLGTGMAPFRSFLQHRDAQRRKGIRLGPATLFCGFRHEASDYYFREELAAHLSTGVLSQIHVAFSHDVAPGEKLFFVPDYIRKNPSSCWPAISSEGVELYYCGPAFGIPEAILAAFVDAGIAVGDVSESQVRLLVDAIKSNVDRFHCEMF